MLRKTMKSRHLLATMVAILGLCHIAVFAQAANTNTQDNVLELPHIKEDLHDTANDTISSSFFSAATRRRLSKGKKKFKQGAKYNRESSRQGTHAQAAIEFLSKYGKGKSKGGENSSKAPSCRGKAGGKDGGKSGSKSPSMDGKSGGKSGSKPPSTNSSKSPSMGKGGKGSSKAPFSCDEDSDPPSVSVKPSETPSVSVQPSETPSLSVQPSKTPSLSVQPSTTPSMKPSGLETSPPSVSAEPSAGPSHSPSVSLEPSVSQEPSAGPSPTPSVSQEPSISQEPSPSSGTSPPTACPATREELSLCVSVDQSGSLDDEFDDGAEQVGRFAFDLLAAVEVEVPNSNYASNTFKTQVETDRTTDALGTLADAQASFTPFEALTADGNTNIEAAIRNCNDQLDGDDRKDDRVLVLVGDGAPNRCSISDGCDPLDSATAAADAAKDVTAGILVITVFIGDPTDEGFQNFQDFATPGGYAFRIEEPSAEELAAVIADVVDSVVCGDTFTFAPSVSSSPSISMSPMASSDSDDETDS